jgi:hypothetical protein
MSRKPSQPPSKPSLAIAGQRRDRGHAAAYEWQAKDRALQAWRSPQA